MIAAEIGQNLEAQEALRRRLAPEIATLTMAYYAPDDPHPYLQGIASGGVLLRETANLETETEVLTDVHVSGLSGGAFSKLNDLVNRGLLPGTVTADSTIWSITTNHGMCPWHDTARQLGPLDGPVRTSSHSLGYWDGKRWQVIREDDPSQSRTQGADWQKSTLRPEEELALRMMAEQTRGLHQVAEVYGGNGDGFVADMDNVPANAQTRKYLNIAFASALSMRHEVKAELNRGLSGYMSYYRTGYQRVRQLVEDIPTEDGASDRAQPVYVSPTGKALAHMYRRSASQSRLAVRVRAQAARLAGHPYPLPATW